jgi:opacity protein-like surface antigen
MRSVRICLLALAAALLLGAPAAQADTTYCGLTPFPTLGKTHRFVGAPVVYDVTNNDSRYFDAIVDWGDGQDDIAGFNPGDTHEFSHAYSSPGSYDVVMYVRVADSTEPLGLCSGSTALGTVRVRGRGRH